MLLLFLKEIISFYTRMKIRIFLTNCLEFVLIDNYNV